MKFYKYAPWTGTSGDYTRQNLLENAVYLASPVVFNDPFDFNPVYDYTATHKEQVQHYSRILRKKLGIHKTESVRNAKKHLLENQAFRGKNGIEHFACESKKGLRNLMGVSCFTTKPRNSPMWAHYAEGYQGICLEWTFPEKGEHFYLPDGVEKVSPLVLQPLKYADERAVCRIFDDSIPQANALYQSIITKSSDWSYEDEYRLITPGYVGKVYYHVYRLSAIIIGCKATPERIHEIKDFVRKIKYQPRLYQAQLSERIFDYEIVPLK